MNNYIHIIYQMLNAIKLITLHDHNDHINSNILLKQLVLIPTKAAIL